MEIDLAKLGRFITRQFELDQLQALCRELGVSYEQLLGDTRRAKSFDLVTLMRDRGQLSALMAAVAQARPDAFDPQAFIAQPGQDAAARRRTRWLILLGGGGIALLLILLFTALTRRAPSAPSPQAPAPSETLAVAGQEASATPAPALSPPPATASPTMTPSPAPPTPTPRPTASPAPSATPSPSPSPTPAPTATPTPSATPTLSEQSPALSYDAGTRTLVLAPGDADLGRARLCTPLNAYQNDQVLYVVENVADSLGLFLPAQARVTHTYPEGLTGDPIVLTLEVRPHPQTGVKVSGEAVDFTGCDLLVSQNLRLALGFPQNLGAFDAPPRFDHGWVTIEF